MVVLRRHGRQGEGTGAYSRYGDGRHSVARGRREDSRRRQGRLRGHRAPVPGRPGVGRKGPHQPRGRYSSLHPLPNRLHRPWHFGTSSHFVRDQSYAVPLLRGALPQGRNAEKRCRRGCGPCGLRGCAHAEEARPQRGRVREARDRRHDDRSRRRVVQVGHQPLHRVSPHAAQEAQHRGSQAGNYARGYRGGWLRRLHRGHWRRAAQASCAGYRQAHRDRGHRFPLRLEEG